MPCYMWVPSGGFRVVYEYANQLSAQGHDVTVVHPRQLKKCYRERLTLRSSIRNIRYFLKELFYTPTVNWHVVDEKVRLLFVPNSDPRHIPEADALFATAWHTVDSVLRCPPSRGEKFYLIQHYETFLGPKHLVDDTWRAPLHKIVIAKWLLELGEELGAKDLTYIPNAIDHDRFTQLRPIEGRPFQISMMFSTTPLKGSSDGLKALELAREQFPDLQVVLFGTPRRPARIPAWMTYYRSPAQEFLVSEIYNKSSIFLSPSWTEGFGLPPAEAAACGCAVVATDSGGVREFIKPGVTGLLSPPKDPEALAENLCLLLGNEKLRIRLAQSANALIRQFTWQHNSALLDTAIRLRLRKSEQKMETRSCRLRANTQ